MSDKVLKDLLSLKPDARYLRIDHPIYDHFGEKPERATACRKLALDPVKKNILFFGFIRDYKGLDLLLEAAALLPADYTVIVAGEVYGSFDKYAALIEKLGLQQTVALFNQYIGDEEVPLYFGASDVCVLPYRSATQSGITSMAMHFAVPVIATNVGGLSELVHHEKSGLIVPQPDPQQIAVAIRRYFEQGLAEKFILALEEEKKAHSWEAFSTKLLQFAQTLR
jgi:glycosyltransferase involved in cell wall biosynthesis